MIEAGARHRMILHRTALHGLAGTMIVMAIVPVLGESAHRGGEKGQGGGE